MKDKIIAICLFIAAAVIIVWVFNQSILNKK